MQPMQQLVLDIGPDTPPGFDNFVTGGNAELLAALRASIAGASHLYLWGASGSGRTHLLRAAVAESRSAGRPARYLDAADAGDALPEDDNLLLALDDVEALTPAGQIALFNAFNRARTLRQTLLVAGSRPPLELPLREDLRTRIGQCLIFQARPLDDETRLAILSALAQRRGLQLQADLANFLLHHGRRDLPSLVKVLDALDRASLAQKRPITLPLLRELMRTGLQI